MKKDILRQIVNLIAVGLVILVNGLANTLPLNNQTTGEISDRFDVYFVPAGYVFSIWGLIYVALIVFAVFQVSPNQRENPRLRRIGYWFGLSCLANIAWLFLWHYEYFLLTVLAMLVLLLTLIVIYLILDVGRSQITTTEKWMVHAPFSLYLGWITVATIANITSVLDYYNWSGWGLSAEIWTVIMLAAAGLISAAISLMRSDVIFALVIAWAVIGIAVKHSTVPLVSGAAWLTAAWVLVMMVVGYLLSKNRSSPSTSA